MAVADTLERLAVIEPLTEAEFAVLRNVLVAGQNIAMQVCGERTRLEACVSLTLKVRRATWQVQEREAVDA